MPGPAFNNIRGGVLPKTKCDSMQGLRIELQETEREALQVASTASAIGDVLSGLGGLLMPFQGAITAFAAAYLAGDIADEVIERWLNPLVASTRSSLAGEAESQYATFTSYLYTRSWPLDGAAARAFIMDIDNGISFQWLRQRMVSFVDTAVVETAAPMSSLGTPAEAWSIFYPYDELQNDAIYQANQVVQNQGGISGLFFRLITPNPS